jgi:cation transporter-like permease
LISNETNRISPVFPTYFHHFCTQTQTFPVFQQHWDVFEHIPELFILVPALLGLKGNLDMTLASRLSTQANLGHMDSAKEIVHMVVGNIALVQVQATVAAFIVSVFSMSVGWGINGRFNFDHALLLTASSMFTATSSCFVLGEYELRLLDKRSFEVA